MSEITQPMNLLGVLRRRPDARAIIRGSEQYPSLSGMARFYQTRRGVLVFTEVSGLPEAAKPCGNAVFAFQSIKSEV